MSTGEQMLSLWNGRSDRERMLLLAMGAILGAALLWYGIAAPLRSAADGASAHLRRAAATRDIVQSAEALDLREAATVDEILASAVPEGLAVQRHTAAPGELTVYATSPDAASLFAWLGALQQRFGIAVANLSVTRNSEGGLDIEAVLAGART